MAKIARLVLLIIAAGLLTGAAWIASRALVAQAIGLLALGILAIVFMFVIETDGVTK